MNKLLIAFAVMFITGCNMLESCYPAPKPPDPCMADDAGCNTEVESE